MVRRMFWEDWLSLARENWILLIKVAAVCSTASTLIANTIDEIATLMRKGHEDLFWEESPSQLYLVGLDQCWWVMSLLPSAKWGPKGAKMNNKWISSRSFYFLKTNHTRCNSEGIGTKWMIPGLISEFYETDHCLTDSKDYSIGYIERWRSSFYPTNTEKWLLLFLPLLLMFLEWFSYCLKKKRSFQPLSDCPRS